MKIQTNLGKIKLTLGPPKPENNDYRLDGWYVAMKPKTGHMAADHIEIVKVRVDEKKQEYVLDSAGQSTQYSEELWRYQDWWFSEKIL